MRSRNEMQAWISRYNTTYGFLVRLIEEPSNFVCLEVKQTQTAVFMTGTNYILGRMTDEWVDLRIAWGGRIWDKFCGLNQTWRPRYHVKEIYLWIGIASHKLTLLCVQPRTTSESLVCASRGIFKARWDTSRHFFGESVRGGAVPQNHGVVGVYGEEQVLERMHLKAPNGLGFRIFFTFAPLPHTEVLAIFCIPVRVHFILLWQTPNSNNSFDTPCKEHIFAGTIWICGRCNRKKRSRVASQSQIRF